MEYLSWELDVLTRAVAYPNLSGAATQIGISQPQLSRIIARLEKELSVTLLDREEKRRSGWTRSAHKLAELYAKTFRRFRSDVQLISAEAQPTLIRIGALEGLSELASRFCHGLMRLTDIQVLEVLIFDLNELEEGFSKGELEFIFTSREVSRKKYRYIATLGSQKIERVAGTTDVRVFSSFEFATQLPAKKRKNETGRILVSNSLVIRAKWMKEMGGSGTLPSPVNLQATPRPGEKPVLLIAHDDLPSSLWDTAKKALLAKDSPTGR